MNMENKIPAFFCKCLNSRESKGQKLLMDGPGEKNEVG